VDSARRTCEILRIMKSPPFLVVVAALLVACAAQEGGVLGRNKALVQRAHAEVWSQKNLAAIDEIYAPDYVAHWVGGPDSRGRDTFKQFVADAYRRAPDRTEVVDQTVAEGDLVVTRFTTRGTFDSHPDEPAPRPRVRGRFSRDEGRQHELAPDARSPGNCRWMRLRLTFAKGAGATELEWKW
jgi:predicted SnoaL-like aldol condensation-catalyzing enzyme